MITRNNYEEFFLLYVDNELSPAEKEAVERFVEQHPDLKEEWELLLQCRISPDEMPSLPAKELLLRSETQIHAGNYESWFLSYIDNELDTTSRQAVIDFVRRHPEKNIELQQLQQTVSTPDLNITFPNKELLYRKEEERTGKIAWLPFARIAAAALILGAVGLLVFHPFRNDKHLAKSSTGKAVDTSLARAPFSSGSSTATITAPIASAVIDSKKSMTPTTTSAKKYIAAVTPRTVDPLYHTKNGKEQQRTSNPTGDETVTRTLTKVDPVSPAKTIETDPGRQLAVMDPKTIDRTAKLPVTTATGSDQTQHDATGNMNTSFATQALLSQTISYVDDDSREEMPSPRKNKLRGIFRKVTRTLEKSSAREDDDNKKVTIGGFQFALK